MEKEFTRSIQGYEFTYPLRLFKNEGFDIILGGDWLKTRTPVKYDCEGMSTTIRLNGRKIRLQAHTIVAQRRFISQHSLYGYVHSKLVVRWRKFI